MHLATKKRNENSYQYSLSFQGILQRAALRSVSKIGSIEFYIIKRFGRGPLRGNTQGENLRDTNRNSHDVARSPLAGGLQNGTLHLTGHHGIRRFQHPAERDLPVPIHDKLHTGYICLLQHSFMQLDPSKHIIAERIYRILPFPLYEGGTTPPGRRVNSMFKATLKRIFRPSSSAGQSGPISDKVVRTNSLLRSVGK